MNLLNEINLRKFFTDVRPRYKILYCNFGGKDCRRDWEVIGNLSKCLDEFNFKSVITWNFFLCLFEKIKELYLVNVCELTLIMPKIFLLTLL